MITVDFRADRVALRCLTEQGSNCEAVEKSIFSPAESGRCCDLRKNIMVPYLGSRRLSDSAGFGPLTVMAECAALWPSIPF